LHYALAPLLCFQLDQRSEATAMRPLPMPNPYDLLAIRHIRGKATGKGAKAIAMRLSFSISK